MKPQLELSKLCDTCATIFQGAETSCEGVNAGGSFRRFGTHHVSFEALRAAAGDGCHLCAMLIRFNSRGTSDGQASWSEMSQSFPNKVGVELRFWHHEPFHVLPCKHALLSANFSSWH
jgi:hypothetical protein